MSMARKRKLEDGSMAYRDLHLPKFLLDEVHLKSFEEHREPVA